MMASYEDNDKAIAGTPERDYPTAEHQWLDKKVSEFNELCEKSWAVLNKATREHEENVRRLRAAEAARAAHSDTYDELSKADAKKEVGFRG